MVNMKELLKSKGISQFAVAYDLGVSQQLVSQWCTGKCEPRISQLRKLSNILKVDLETLVECFE